MCRQGWGIRNVTGPESGDIGQHSSFRKSRKVGHPAARYQDSNIWSERKLIEELRYMHRNPRGPAGSPEDWALEQLSPLCLWC